MQLRLHSAGPERLIAFHLAVAAATGNKYFELTMAACMEQIRLSIGVTRTRGNARPRSAPTM